MKKEFLKPSINIIKLAHEDIITTSLFTDAINQARNVLAGDGVRQDYIIEHEITFK